jgi:hypothetical protein
LWLIGGDWRKVPFDSRASFVTTGAIDLKLIHSGIAGKCYAVVRNMYQNIKSCVLSNKYLSKDFESKVEVGVRQGENLSPILFALYFNDLEEFLMRNGVTALDGEVEGLVKLLILLYADDTTLQKTSRDV